jgi:protein tyrosine phosphatase (PTP) superfamily phosphohydrolase (DUF442 family)
MKIKNLKIIFAALAVVIFIFPVFCFAHQPSSAISYALKNVQGLGPLPYNYRVIDAVIYAGGHPLNPANGLNNTDEQAMRILKYLKSKGVATVIDLQNDRKTEDRYARLLNEAGLKRIHVPLSWMKTPSPDDWKKMSAAFSKPVYIHCKWGADRTGIIIAKYLIAFRGYTVKEALDAVSTGGSHAGKVRGIDPAYRYDPVMLDFLRKN